MLQYSFTAAQDDKTQRMGEEGIDLRARRRKRRSCSEDEAMSGGLKTRLCGSAWPAIDGPPRGAGVDQAPTPGDVQRLASHGHRQSPSPVGRAPPPLLFMADEPPLSALLSSPLTTLHRPLSSLDFGGQLCVVERLLRFIPGGGRLSCVNRSREERRTSKG
ncbi:hypothetical protein NL676_019110 [Syzygium grande]|nr:hypothetical protein NL676_019110 [Syzygium grande]